MYHKLFFIIVKQKHFHLDNDFIYSSKTEKCKKKTGVFELKWDIPYLTVTGKLVKSSFVKNSPIYWWVSGSKT